MEFFALFHRTFIKNAINDGVFARCRQVTTFFLTFHCLYVASPHLFSRLLSSSSSPASPASPSSSFSSSTSSPSSSCCSRKGPYLRRTFPSHLASWLIDSFTNYDHFFLFNSRVGGGAAGGGVGGGIAYCFTPMKK